MEHRQRQDRRHHGWLTGDGAAPRRQAGSRTAPTWSSTTGRTPRCGQHGQGGAAAGGDAVAIQADIADTEAVESLVQRRGRPVRSLDVRRGQRRRQRLQATLGDPRQTRRQDDEPHGRRASSTSSGSRTPHARRRAGHGGVRVGQLPRPARARSARRGEGRHGDARQVPRHRARAGRRHHGGRVPGPDRHRLVPLSTPANAWDWYEKNWLAHDAVGRTSPHRDEVAEVMAFLCSPRSAAVNGQTIVVDGGLSLATMPDRLRPEH